MARLCERPGCSQPAQVIYGIDADQLSVWIEPFDATLDYRAGVLCRRHADAMVVPLGWTLDDRRELEPRLFKSRDTASPPKLRRARRPRSSAGDDTGQLELGAVDAGLAPDDTHPGIDDTKAWKPVFDQSDDLDGLLTAESPLLSRAFGKRARPGPT
ncbi:MAG: DUF3499 family protein [Actinomycetota bacterium]